MNQKNIQDLRKTGSPVSLTEMTKQEEELKLKSKVTQTITFSALEALKFHHHAMKLVLQCD